MARRLEIYKCERCGNIVEVLQGGPGQLVCCGEPMERLGEQTADSSTEKHVPVVEETDDGYRVVVGSVPHPMEERHWIQWIELVCGGRAYREFLQPGDRPEAVFRTDHCDDVYAREHCNVHGLWRG
jgi:superoxide reductase